MDGECGGAAGGRGEGASLSLSWAVGTLVGGGGRSGHAKVLGVVVVSTDVGGEQARARVLQVEDAARGLEVAPVDWAQEPWSMLHVLAAEC